MLSILEMWPVSCIQIPKLIYRNPWMFMWKEKKILRRRRINLDFYDGLTKEELRRNSEKNRGTMKKRNVSSVWFWSQHDERLLQTINNFVRSRSTETSFLRPKKKSVNLKVWWIQCFIFSLSWILLDQAPGVLLAFVARAAEAAAWSAGRDSATFQ